MTAAAWIVGSGGLLGQALTRELGRRSHMKPVSVHLPWQETPALVAAATAEFRSLLKRADGGEWSIFWAAGAGVTSSSEIEFTRELDQLGAILTALSAVLATSKTTGRGAVFYASSAGGVYAGSANAPFTEDSAPVPISDYGRYKLKAEKLFSSFAEKNRLALMIGRIANLYGPGQRLDKAQGLISHVARAQLSANPASIFVPLETIRDYLFVDDCAALIFDAVDRLHRLDAVQASTPIVKILASGQGTTIASVLGYFRGLSKSAPNVMIATSAFASRQALDLRMRSTVWTELDRRTLTPLPVGIYATVQDIRARVQLSG
jgi:UDP-glucose 4-epimerase